jgi:hypothetical protein
MASKRRKRKRECESKYRYESEDAAIRAVRGIIRRVNSYHDADAYKCSFCGGWHIGRTSIPKEKILHDRRNRDKSSRKKFLEG